MRYCFSCPECGNKKEVIMTIAEMEDVRDGKVIKFELNCCKLSMVRDFAQEGMSFDMGRSTGNSKDGFCSSYEDGEIWRYKHGYPTDHEAELNSKRTRAECQKLKPKRKRRQPKYYSGGVKGK